MEDIEIKKLPYYFKTGEFATSLNKDVHPIPQKYAPPIDPETGDLIDITGYEQFEHVFDILRFWMVDIFPNKMTEFVVQFGNIERLTPEHFTRIDNILERFKDFKLTNIVKSLILCYVYKSIKTKRWRFKQHRYTNCLLRFSKNLQINTIDYLATNCGFITTGKILSSVLINLDKIKNRQMYFKWIIDKIKEGMKPTICTIINCVIHDSLELTEFILGNCTIETNNHNYSHRIYALLFQKNKIKMFDILIKYNFEITSRSFENVIMENNLRCIRLFHEKMISQNKIYINKPRNPYIIPFKLSIPVLSYLLEKDIIDVGTINTRFHEINPDTLDFLISKGFDIQQIRASDFITYSFSKYGYVSTEHIKLLHSRGFVPSSKIHVYIINDKKDDTVILEKFALLKSYGCQLIPKDAVYCAQRAIDHDQPVVLKYIIDNYEPFTNNLISLTKLVSSSIKNNRNDMFELLMVKLSPLMYKSSISDILLYKNFVMLKYIIDNNIGIGGSSIYNEIVRLHCCNSTNINRYFARRSGYGKYDTSRICRLNHHICYLNWMRNPCCHNTT